MKNLTLACLLVGTLAVVACGGEVIPESAPSQLNGSAGSAGTIATAGSSGSAGMPNAAGSAGSPNPPPGTGGSSTPPSNCPDPKSPLVHYVSQDPKACAALDFLCGDEQKQFSSECGCGCIDLGSPCASENEAQCIADPNCQPGYKGKCDCSCPGPVGYEGKNCEMCSPDCFTFAACVPLQPGCPDPDSALVQYISQDVKQCAVIDFGCSQQAFDNTCGCGCIAVAPSCGSLSEPACKADPACQGGYAALCDCACAGGPKGYEPGGCPSCSASCFAFKACVPVMAGCPDPEAPFVHYTSQDAAQCALIDFACSPGQQAFSDACGCGCIDLMD